MQLSPETLGLRADYEDQLGPRVRKQLRLGIGVVMVLQTGFLLVDYNVVPQRFEALLAIRMAWNAFLLGVVFLVPFLSASRAMIVGCIVAGFGLIGIITVAGGPGSGYSPGLMLLVLGFPVLLPLSGRQAAGIVGCLLSLLVLTPIALGGEWTSKELFTYACFPVAAGLECLAACRILDGLRFSDFLQRRELESARDQMEELDRAKSRFTANIHHELRTPLTLMLAPIEGMQSGDMGEVPEGLQRTLRSMQSNGLRLLKLINNLLDLAKIESDQLSIRRIPVNLGRLIREVVDGARPMGDRKGLSMEVEGFEDLGVFHADPDALEKILVNLIGNALKFTDEGRITVRAEQLCEEDAASEVYSDGGIEIVVADTGMGIPADQLGRVFDRFAQVDGSTTRKHEGTGIGLSLVQELVGLHGGRVWATSGGLGEGSEMHVTLPLGSSDDDPDEEVMLEADGERALSAAKSFKALASEVSMDLEEGGEAKFASVEHTVSRWEATRQGDDWRDELPSHPEGTPEVVIAEDNAEMRRLLAFLVAKEFVVRPTRNGREALEEVRAKPPELVLTDVMMPEMSGTDLCKAIKEDEALSSVPVVLVTSKAEREMKIEGLELGADDYVTKPFHPRELMARVRSLVRIRSLQQELASQNEVLAQSNVDLEQALRDLKEAEVQLVQAERLAAVGELSAGVAHEVNNPLNFARNSLSVLRTYVQDLLGVAALVAELDTQDPKNLQVQLLQLERKKEELGFEDLASDMAELIGIVTEGLDRTSRLVTDLRDFASPAHEGGVALIDVRAGLQSTTQLLAHRFREEGVTLEMEVSEPLEPLQGDPGGLNQVFLNLLKNAVEAIEGQNGVITVSARMDSSGPEGETLEVRVRDTGEGISEEVRSRLFEPFFTTKEAGKGTGLGLAMCRRIVVELGGTIDLVPAEPGTCAVVRVPTHRPEGRADAEANAREGGSEHADR